MRDKAETRALRLFMWGEKKVQVTWHTSDAHGSYIRAEYRKLRKPWRYGRLLRIERGPRFEELSLKGKLHAYFNVVALQGKKLPGGSEDEVIRKFKEKYGE